MSISIRTLGIFVSIKTISIDIKLIQFKFFCLFNIDHSKAADQSESSGKSVIIAAVLESRLSTVVESNTCLRSKGNFFPDSTTFLNFSVPDSTTSSKIACLCTVMKSEANVKDSTKMLPSFRFRKIPNPLDKKENS